MGVSPLYSFILEKLKLQQDWIGDLTEQNEMLVRAVEELEIEATERVKMLEDKLQRSAENINEGRRKLEEQENIIREMEKKIIEGVCLGKQLEIKKEECENLQKNMIDMRQALTEEVATKHDMILKLKKEVQELEERCIQADKQTAFRDDIIKELRKEIKQLKQQVTQEEVGKLNRTIDVLQNTLEKGKVLHDEEEKDTVAEISCLNDKIREYEGCVCELKKKMHVKKSEISNLHGNIKEMETCICNLNNQLKVSHEQNSALNNRLKELELYSAELEHNSKDGRDVCILQDKIKNLESCVTELQSKSKVCKNCKQNIKVGFSGNIEVQTDAQDPSEIQLNLMLSRDELIKYQTSTLEMLQQELHDLHEREKKLMTEIDQSYNENQTLQKKVLELEIQLEENQKNVCCKNKEDVIKKQKETIQILEEELESYKKKEATSRAKHEQQCICIQQLRNKISDLESSLQATDKRANNLQLAVDLYNNTINVLEASEDKYKLELDHQQTTITNLQDALISTKHELDEYKQKYDENIEDQQKLLTTFIGIISDNELDVIFLNKQLNLITEKYETLQELNYCVEIEHCASLQDIEVLDNQLYRYCSLLKSVEEELKVCKCNMTKVVKQKKCFEDVVQYFRTEMSTMYEQLQNLQDLLNMSNDSAQEEANKLTKALDEVKLTNEKLTVELTAAEQKLALEVQMNQLNEVKIAELEKLISDKDLDSDKNDETIKVIKKSLQASLKQNEEFQTTIKSLNQSISEFQDIIKNQEEDSMKSKEMCKYQMGSCKEKIAELKKLLEEKTQEYITLEEAYNNQSKSLTSYQIELNKTKAKLKSKQNYLKMTIDQLKEQLNKSKEEKKQLESELKNTQVHLNVSITKNSTKEAEIKRYKRLVGELKTTLMDLNTTLSRKDVKLLSKCKTEECKKYIEQLNNEETVDQTTSTENLCLNCPCEMDFYSGVVETLKNAVMDLKEKLFGSEKKTEELEAELHKKITEVQEISRTQLENEKEYNEVKQKLLNALNRSQSEEKHYKKIAKKLEQDIKYLRQEMDIKTVQMIEMERSTIEINGSKSIQLTVAQDEINRLNEQLNKLLIAQRSVITENEKLHNQTEILQSKVKNLEETSNLMKNEIEKYLLELQMVQNEKETLNKKNQDLLIEHQSLQSSYDSIRSQQRDCCTYDVYHEASTSIKPHLTTCQSPWSLGSQGNESVHEDSPSRSPCFRPNRSTSWFATNYKNDSDESLDAVDWVTKVENLAEEVKRTHKIWKHKMETSDCTVSKDCRK